MRYWIMFFFFLIVFSLPLGITGIRWLRSHTAEERSEKKRAFLALCRRQCVPFLILTAVYLVALSSLIRADIDYKDDIWRVFGGSRGWKAFGRYLAHIGCVFLHGDGFLADISPLPQLLAAVILVIASLVVIRLISGRSKASLWCLIAVVPLGLSPYFLECFSYKYDPPYMALSVLFSVLPLLLSEQNFLLFSSAVALGSFAMCTSYQSSSGILPMLVLVLSALRFSRGEPVRKIGRFLLAAATGYVVALLAFRLFVVPRIESYVSDVVPTAGQLIPNTLANLKKYYDHVRSEFRIEWLILAGLLAAGFLYVVVRDAAGRRARALLVGVAALALLALCAFGVYPLLTDPLFAPRGMYGFGALLALLGVAVASARRAHPAKLACLFLSWAFITFALTYGNALHLQDEYTDFRIAMTLEDLNRLEEFNTDETKSVQISGSIGLSSAFQNLPEDYGLLKQLIPIDFHGNWPFGPIRFYAFYGLKNVVWDSEMEREDLDLPVLLDTSYHTIRGDGHYFLIELKK